MEKNNVKYLQKQWHLTQPIKNTRKNGFIKMVLVFVLNTKNGIGKKRETLTTLQIHITKHLLIQTNRNCFKNGYFQTKNGTNS